MNQTNPAYLANPNKRKCCNKPIRMQPVSSAGRCRATNAKGEKTKTAGVKDETLATGTTKRGKKSSSWHGTLSAGKHAASAEGGKIFNLWRPLQGWFWVYSCRLKNPFLIKTITRVILSQSAGLEIAKPIQVLFVFNDHKKSLLTALFIPAS